jgi:hypothetical protein
MMDKTKYGVLPMASLRIEAPPKLELDREWYQAQLRRLDLTQGQLAQRMNQDPTQLSYIISGARELKVSQAVAMADVFGVSLSEVVRRFGLKGDADNTVAVQFEVHDDLHVSKLPKPYVEAPAPPGCPSTGFAVRLKAPHSAGNFWSGMLCFMAPGNHDVRECIGRPSLIETEDKKRLFGVLSRRRDAGDFALVHPATGHSIEHVRVATANPSRWYFGA